MRIVILGLSITSSWGNGHATTYRCLVRALVGRGHEVLFLERDMPWYAENRDLPVPPYGTSRLYGSLDELEAYAGAVREAALVIVGSYVPDGIAVGEWATATARGVTSFYDIDTPVTLAALARGDCAYLSAWLIPRYHLYLSFTGGPTLDQIRGQYGARLARPLYCAVDPDLYYPDPSADTADVPAALTRPQSAPRRRATALPHPSSADADNRPQSVSSLPSDRSRRPDPAYDLGYLGTYSADRQPALERLLIEPARRLPARRFAVVGPQFPDTIDWPANVARSTHLPPSEHRSFYNAQRFTLSVTRAAMVAAGYSPSVRLFEAAACATPVITDPWSGLETFFTPGTEILVAETAEDVIHMLDLPEPARQAIGRAARTRVLAAHTGEHRAVALEQYVEEAVRSQL